MVIFRALNREQREAIGLLQIGTFLEYFDLMLYVHMAVLLNELFFPKTDAHTTALLSAFAFCSTYVLRPFGALVFGWIGDNIGRKTTVIITTTMMSISCVIMANVPTYAQIGITAGVIVTVCRIFQGLSSMGEATGAEIYILETTKPPVRYPAVAMIGSVAALGGMAALSIATLVTTHGFNWRIAFWIGAGVAVVGSIARTRLRETPEFLQSKRMLKYDLEQLGSRKFISKKKVSKKSVIAFFLLHCGWPLCFYLGYMFFNPLLREKWGYSAQDIISHNFLLSIVVFVAVFSASIMSYRIHPLKITKFRGSICIVLMALSPILINIAPSSHFIFLLQAALLASSLAITPGESAIYKYFPVLRRFTFTSVTYASSRAVMYIITSFGLVYLTEAFGQYGLWFILTPISIGFLWGINHFIKLEKESGDYFMVFKEPQEIKTQSMTTS